MVTVSYAVQSSALCRLDFGASSHDHEEELIAPDDFPEEHDSEVHAHKHRHSPDESEHEHGHEHPAHPVSSIVFFEHNIAKDSSHSITPPGCTDSAFHQDAQVLLSHELATIFRPPIA